MSLAQQTTDALVTRREELQFLASQYGLSGSDTPQELTEEFEAIEAELRRRAEQPLRG